MRLVVFLCLILSPMLATFADDYTYYAAHIPPDNEWVVALQLVNPGGAEARVIATTFEQGQVGTFAMAGSETLTLAGGAAMVVSPKGSGQRWVTLASDQPLGGSISFGRTISGQEEKAILPLTAEGEAGTTVVFPHIPGDRGRFFSGAVLLNPNDSALELDFIFLGEAGNLLDVAADGLPATLAAHQKWVGLLSGTGTSPSWFDDSGSAEKVAAVVVQSSLPVTGFELFGYTGEGAGRAISGIKATRESAERIWPLGLSLAAAEFNGFVVLNRGAQSVQASIQVFDAAGAVLAEAETNLGPYRKLTGLNHVTGGFYFPFGDENPIISIAADRSPASLLLSADTDLHLFGLAGSGSRELDGATLQGLAAHIAFAQPRGVLEVFKYCQAGSVDITKSVNGQISTETHTLAAGAMKTFALDEGTDFVQIAGASLYANVTEQTPDGALTVLGSSEIGPGPSPLAAQLQSHLDNTVNQRGAPGAALYVRTPTWSWSGASGVADLTTGALLKADDLMRMGSTTKNFVGTVMLKLQEEGKLDLDDPMSNYLESTISEHIENGQVITLRQLLNMTSGIFNYTDSDAFNDAVEINPDKLMWTHEEILAFIYQEPACFPPGQGWEYSNTNYVLLDLIAARVGTTLAGEIRRIILDPQEMTNTYMEIREPRSGGFHGLTVRGYDGAEDITEINDGFGFGDGGLISTVEDMGRYFEALMVQKRILTTASLAEMRTFHSREKYGLGLEMRDTAYGTAWAHSGSTGGFQGDLLVLPERGVIVAVLTNSFSATVTEPLVDGALALLFR